MIQIPPTTVQAKNLPGTSISSSVDAEILGGPQVRFLEMIGKTQESIGDFMLARQDQIDMTTVMNAESEWAIAEDGKLTELLSRKGENAFDLLGEAEQWFDGYGVDPTQDKPGKSGQPGTGAAPGQISAGFREKRYNNMNERQQQYFDMAKNKRKAAFIRSVGTHENKERLASVIKSADSAIASHVASAIRNYNNPAQLQEDLKKIENTLKAKAAVSGLSTEELDREREVAKAMIHEGILNQLLAAKDIPGATEYFMENMSELEGKAIPAMKAELRRQTVIEYGSNEASRILKLDPGVWNAELQAIPDAEIRKEARTNLYHMAGWEEKARRKAREDNQNKAYDLIWGEKPISDISQLPPDIQKTLTMADRETFRSMIRARDGEWPVVDPQSSAKERMALDLLHDENFLNEYTTTKYWNKLSKQDHSYMQARIRGIKDRGFDEYYPDFQTAFTERMLGLGWSQTDDTQRWNILQAEARAAYQNWQEQHKGLRPDTEMMHGILDGLTKSKDKSMSRTKELEKQYPRAVTTVTNLTRSQVITSFKKEHWTKKNQDQKDQLEGQLTSAMAAWVLAEQKAGRSVSPGAYYARVQVEGRDVVDFNGKDVLYGSIPPEQRGEAKVDVEVDWAIDKTYTGKEISEWLAKHPKIKDNIESSMIGRGIPATLGNIATEVHGWKGKLEKAKEERALDEDRSRIIRDKASEDAERLETQIDEQNELRTKMEGMETQANEYKKDLAKIAIEREQTEKLIEAQQKTIKSNNIKLKKLKDKVSKQVKEAAKLQKAKVKEDKKDNEKKPVVVQSKEKEKSTQEVLQGNLDKIVNKQNEERAKQAKLYTDIDWRFNNEVFTESSDLTDEKAYPDWFLYKKLVEVEKEVKQDGESPLHTEIMSMLVGTMDSRGIDY